MKRKILFTMLAAIATAAVNAITITPDSCSVEHRDSCWYITMNYSIEKLPTDNELIMTSRVCSPDTCINDTTHRFQGKKYTKRFAKQYGYKPTLAKHGHRRCTIILPEEYATDTLCGITYCEYITPQSSAWSIDSTHIILPQCPPLHCHRLHAPRSAGDRLAGSNPYICPMRKYRVLHGDSTNIPAHPNHHVHYALNSALLRTDYRNNASALDSLSAAITTLLADSTTRIECIQIIGYTAPDHSDEITPKLGYKRATAMRDHIKQRCHLPDSIFEVADGGKNWPQIYTDIAKCLPKESDSLITLLQNEPDGKKRLTLLRKFHGGACCKAISNDSVSQQRGACCARIYYHNRPDSITNELNAIVAELQNNPHPDYHRLHRRLKKYGNDPRALNIKGVIDYRLHRLHAAEEAFTRAAMQGDEQAEKNLVILANTK